MRILALAGLVVLAGCVARRMDSWVGRPSDELLARWGAPDSRITLRDGSHVLTWSEAWLDGETHACRKSFTIGRDGRVSRWTTSDCHAWASVPLAPRSQY